VIWSAVIAKLSKTDTDCSKQIWEDWHRLSLKHIRPNKVDTPTNLAGLSCVRYRKNLKSFTLQLPSRRRLYLRWVSSRFHSWNIRDSWKWIRIFYSNWSVKFIAFLMARLAEGQWSCICAIKTFLLFIAHWALHHKRKFLITLFYEPKMRIRQIFVSVQVATTNLTFYKLLQ